VFEYLNLTAIYTKFIRRHSVSALSNEETLYCVHVRNWEIDMYILCLAIKCASK